MKVFITGGTGFIGQHLINELIDRQYTIYVLSRVERQSSNENLIFVKGDISNIADFSDILKSIDCFINIAGEKKDERNMNEVNVLGVATILKELIKYPYIKFLQVSSAGVYGIQKHPATVLSEDSETFPDNIYEKTKFEAECIIKEFGLKFNLCYSIIRPSNVFGENDKGLKLLNLFKAIKANRFFLLNPDAIVNYVYVGQVVYIIRQIIEKDVFYGKIYNINSACTISEFLSAIKNVLGVKNRTLQIPKAFFFVVRIIGKIADLLPQRFQIINSGKYRELTSFKYYSTNEINKILNRSEKEMLAKGLLNLGNHYKEKGLL